MDDLIGAVALVAGGLRVGVNDGVGGEASGRAGLSVVVDGVVVEFLQRGNKQEQERYMSSKNRREHLARYVIGTGEQEGESLQRRGRTSCVRACAACGP